jgi:hypothetical protein
VTSSRFILVIIFSSLSANGAFADDVDNFVGFCRMHAGEQVHQFERKNRITFEAAVRIEQNQISNISADKFQSACMSMLGTQYGKVRFRSKPSGATIFVGGDKQSDLTDVTYTYPIGTYPYKISNQIKQCDSNVTVTPNVTKEVICQ